MACSVFVKYHICVTGLTFICVSVTGLTYSVSLTILTINSVSVKGLTITVLIFIRFYEDHGPCSLSIFTCVLNPLLLGFLKNEFDLHGKMCPPIFRHTAHLAVYSCMYTPSSQTNKMKCTLSLKQEAEVVLIRTTQQEAEMGLVCTNSNQTI